MTPIDLNSGRYVSAETAWARTPLYLAHRIARPGRSPRTSNPAQLVMRTASPAPFARSTLPLGRRHRSDGAGVIPSALRKRASSPRSHLNSADRPLAENDATGRPAVSSERRDPPRRCTRLIRLPSCCGQLHRFAHDADTGSVIPLLFIPLLFAPLTGALVLRTARFTDLAGGQTTKFTMRPGTTIDFRSSLPSTWAKTLDSANASSSTVASLASTATNILARSLPLT